MKYISKIQFHKEEGKLIHSKIFLETLRVGKKIGKYPRLMESEILLSYSQN
jgi:hypothetical protein